MYVFIIIKNINKPIRSILILLILVEIEFVLEFS